MSRSFLIVLPKEMRSGVAPAASAISISATVAVSKQEPMRGEQRQHFRRRVGLHGIEHAAVGQRLGKGLVVVAHDFEVDDEAGLGVEALAAAVAQEFLDTFGHSTLPNGPSDGDPFKK